MIHSNTIHLCSLKSSFPFSSIFRQKTFFHFNYLIGWFSFLTDIWEWLNELWTLQKTGKVNGEWIFFYTVLSQIWQVISLILNYLTMKMKYCQVGIRWLGRLPYVKIINITHSARINLRTELETIMNNILKMVWYIFFVSQ